MSERSSYPAGTFSWTELVTSDLDAAKAFYSSVFGWSYEDSPVGDGIVYSMASRDGLEVAAMFTAPDQPPHWNCYVTVESADAATARARELGATVLAEPFDIFDVGRSAVLADPAGAAFFLWEARAHIGARLVNAPGALTWNDLITPDPAAAAEFYGALFGWTADEIPGAGGYRVIKNGDQSNGGMMPTQEQMGDVPPNWLPYFGHEDVNAVLGQVNALGGQVLSGPMAMPQGTIAVVSDPQGAVFAIWTGAYDA